MNNLISISTGNFWDGKTKLDNNAVIRQINNLNVDGIEVTFADKEYLAGFFTDEVKQILNKFKLVGMHLPGIYYTRSEQTKNIIKKCYCVYRLIKADYAVIHINWLKDPTLFKGTKWNIVIENGGSRHGFLVKDMQNLLKKNRQFKMVLDVNHAYETDEIDLYVKKLKNKIYAVHLGGGEIPKKPMHRQFHKASKEYLEACEPIKRLNCPIVIESSFPKDTSLIKKELGFVRNWLKK